MVLKKQNIHKHIQRWKNVILSTCYFYFISYIHTLWLLSLEKSYVSHIFNVFIAANILLKSREFSKEVCWDLSEKKVFLSSHLLSAAIAVLLSCHKCYMLLTYTFNLTDSLHFMFMYLAYISMASKKHYIEPITIMYSPKP